MDAQEVWNRRSLESDRLELELKAEAGRELKRESGASVAKCALPPLTHEPPLRLAPLRIQPGRLSQTSLDLPNFVLSRTHPADGSPSTTV